MLPAGARRTAERDLHWGAQALAERLGALLPGLAVEIVAHASSTNSELLARARGAAPGAGSDGRALFLRRRSDLQPCLLVAEHQSAGRGRLGRPWTAVPDASLTFSLALAYAPRDWSGLSLAVGVAIAEALQALAGPGTPRVVLKWPNDLWLSGRKLAGVLIETLGAGERRLAVIGIGINIAPLDEVGQAAASLREIAPQATPAATLAAIAPPLLRAIADFEREGFAPFATRYAGLDMLAGVPVQTTDARCPQGTARGVDAVGGLRVEAADGKLHLLVGGEVSVRPEAPPRP